MTYLFSANDAPVLSNQATHNLEQVLADDSTAKVIFVESQVSDPQGQIAAASGQLTLNLSLPAQQ